MNKATTVLTALAAVWMGAANAITVSDPSDWSSGWAYSTIETSGVGTAGFTVEPSGGNPGARLNSTTVTPSGADTAFGAAVYLASSLPAPVSGTPFTMSVDVLSGPGGFGQGQGVQVLVSQGGSLYQTSVGITTWPINSFTTLTFSGAFTSGAFTKVSGGGPATPSFDGATPTSFGFAVGNNMSATLTQYYDNWAITFASAAIASTPVPTLSTQALLWLGLLMVGTALWSLRKRNRDGARK
jgi:LPXTG-motif cell wall-anchored protein